MVILVVDGANVVGAVPDGWWRDRAGAAARLHAGLVAAPLPFDAIELVLEGRARAGAPSGTIGRVTTVHASASGDDEIVARCREHAADSITVATADRGLLARLESFGVTALGPRELRRQLGTA
jgi:hypothetical protein